MRFTETSLMGPLNSEQRLLFQSQYNIARKSPTTGVLLCLFLGGLGAHHFYLGRVGLGILYIVFCLTLIPAIVSFVELFFMAGRIHRYNQRRATEIVEQIQTLRATA